MPKQQGIESNIALDDVIVEEISETLAGLLALTAVNENNKTLLTSETMIDSVSSLEQFLQKSTTNITTLSTMDLSKTDLQYMLGHSAVMAAQKLCQILTQGTPSLKRKKHTWQALQGAAEKLHAGSTTEESSALAVSIVFGALSLLQSSQNFEPDADDNDGDDDTTRNSVDPTKAVSSALSSTTSRNKPLRHAGRATAVHVLRTFLIHAAHTDNLDLSILNHFAKAFKLGGGKEISIAPHITANVIQNALRENLDTMPFLHNQRNFAFKKRLSGALALACQLQPWPVLSPELLVEAAIPFDYWHAAEEVCRTSYKFTDSVCLVDSSKGNVVFTSSQQKLNAKRAVERLIDGSMEDRMYRRADSLATSLYEAGGRSWYVEARFNHACETISKVIHKKQIPIVDRQIERVDKAIDKVKQDANIYGNDAEMKIQNKVYDNMTSSDFDPSSEIRKFAIEKLEEAGDLTSAKRLASLHGLDYVYDERAIMLAAAMRRRRYLQYDDVLSGPIPSLTTAPQQLVDAFQELRKEPYHHGPFGLDAEWDEETKGAAVLQLANPETTLLIDIPALLGTHDGVNAMEKTVGALLNCDDSVVAGFACRQDLSRLRASPFVQQPNSRQHWLSGTKAVIDVQNMVGKVEPTLYKTGLARACQHYFSKPLDKAEQCSLWSARPLTDHQRSYAALDAWICVAIYLKLKGGD
ncbi:MAG: hypothetical protein SGILL_001933 [Bacillariaceae sp.]